eukprot:11467841-Alexandrium_andersonii.AAC.1
MAEVSSPPRSARPSSAGLFERPWLTEHMELLEAFEACAAWPQEQPRNWSSSRTSGLLCAAFRQD